MEDSVPARDGTDKLKNIENLIFNDKKINLLNKAPIDLNLSNSRINSNITLGNTFATLSTIDHDADDTSTYSLVSGPGQDDNDMFEIFGNEIALKATSSLAAKDLYSIRLQTTDSGGLAYQKSFSLRTNEAPSNITLSAELIENNLKPGTTVGRINTTDKDVNESFTYSLASGFGDTDNPAFKITGSKLKIRENIDYNTKILFNSNSSY